MVLSYLDKRFSFSMYLLISGLLFVSLPMFLGLLAFHVKRVSAISFTFPNSFERQTAKIFIKSCARVHLRKD